MQTAYVTEASNNCVKIVVTPGELFVWLHDTFRSKPFTEITVRFRARA